MRDLRLSGHALLAAVFPALAVAAQHPNVLFARQSTCSDPSLSKCPQAGVPANFCCGSGSTCIPLAGNTTLLCCPAGADCKEIKPITCDLNAQNITLYPSNTLKTTVFTVPLPACNGQCCPFGYSCNGAGNCALKADQTARPGASPISSTPSSSSPSASSTSGRATSTPITSASPSSATPLIVAEEQCSSFPASAVLAGFFPGLAAGILLSIACVCILGARRRKKARKSGSSFGNISDPVGVTDMRSDFLRKYPPTVVSPTAGSTPDHRGRTAERVKSIFRKPNGERGFSLAPPLPLNVQKSAVATTQNVTANPFTPPLQRMSSFEDVNIFADGDTASSRRGRDRASGGSLRDSDVKNRHQTTFSDLLERSSLAGLQKGHRKFSTMKARK